MDWNRVEGNWKQLKGKVKEQRGSLTNDNLNVIAGKRDQLEGEIAAGGASDATQSYKYGICVSPDHDRAIASLGAGSTPWRLQTIAHVQIQRRS